MSWAEAFKTPPDDEPRRPSGTRAKTVTEQDRKYADAALESECRDVENSAHGQRNNRLNVAALKLGHLVGGGLLDEQTVFDRLLSAARTCGLPERESKKTIRSGLTAGQREPRTRPDRETNGAPRGADSSSSSSAGGSGWEPPIAFDDVGSLPEFPVDALPRVLRDWVVAVSVATQTPVALSAAVALAVVSACVQKKYKLEVRRNWSEQLCLYWIVSLPPGARKSPVFREAVAPLIAYEREQATRLAAQVQAAQIRRTVLEKRLKNATDNAAKGKCDIQDVEQLAVELSETTVPVIPRLFADDITPEALSRVLHEQGGRMAVLSAEGGLFDTIAGRYSDGVANLDVFLKGHPGDPLRVDRMSRVYHVDSPALTLGLCVQPAVIEGLAQKSGFRGKGLLARFFYLLPESSVGRRNTNPPPVPQHVADSYSELCARLLALPEYRGPSGEIEPKRLRLGGDALESVESLAQELEPRLGPGADLQHVADWANKLTGGYARLLGLLHLVEHCENCVNSEKQVADLILRADEQRKELPLFLISHALAAFTLMGADPNAANARVLLDWIRKHGLLTFTKRDLHQGVKGTLKKVSDLDAPLALLVEHNFVREVSQPERQGAGRKPSPLFEVNPGSHNSHNSQNSNRGGLS